MLDAIIRAALAECARLFGFPELLKDIPVHVWVKLFTE